ncbi:hypothetical protein KI810_03750 [Geobacter luticola]|uniref:RCC1-like domain-containing protein n=2 Tax=Geomobilimonas luticola TaxID=1114878 RepID=A0ABS5SC28_9BACT|nr:hypothetical protein [Geomobilimonas luticola]
MGTISRMCTWIIAGALMTALLQGCGGKSSSSVAVSTTAPGIFYGNSVVFSNHSTALTWGNNSYGQLGNDTINSGPAPVTISLATGLKSAVAGGTHTLALTNENGGTAWAWGNNGYGQLGDTSTTARMSPVRVVNLTGLTAVAGGGQHSLALKSDGTVWSWGYNGSGQLGDSTNTNQSAPVQVNSLAGVTAITAGGSHSVALKGDGTVWSWGYNGLGQLGNNGTANSAVPVQVVTDAGNTPLAGVTAIAAGGSHTVALKGDGTVWSWGYNALGQLGNNTIISSLLPVPVVMADGVTPLSNVTAVAAGLDHTVALKGDGTVWAWGFNGIGQLGNNDAISSTGFRTTPVQVVYLDANSTAQPLTGIRRIVVIGHHTIAIDGSGAVWTWGDNKYEQLGVPTSSTPLFYSKTAIRVPGVVVKP